MQTCPRHKRPTEHVQTCPRHRSRRQNDAVHRQPEGCMLSRGFRRSLSMAFATARTAPSFSGDRCAKSHFRRGCLNRDLHERGANLFSSAAASAAATPARTTQGPRTAAGTTGNARSYLGDTGESTGKDKERAPARAARTAKSGQESHTPGKNRCAASGRARETRERCRAL